jgi:hypothetical protein
MDVRGKLHTPAVLMWPKGPKVPTEGESVNPRAGRAASQERWISCPCQELKHVAVASCDEYALFPARYKLNFEILLQELHVRWLVTGFSPCRHRFDPRSVHVGFVADSVALGQVCLQVHTSVSPASLIPPMLLTRLHLHVALTKGRRCEAWEPPEKQCSCGNRGALDRKALWLSFFGDRGVVQAVSRWPVTMAAQVWVWPSCEIGDVAY